MVGMTRFERATPSSQARCATKLRYIPLFNFQILSQMQLGISCIRLSRGFASRLAYLHPKRYLIVLGGVLATSRYLVFKFSLVAHLRCYLSSDVTFSHLLVGRVKLRYIPLFSFLVTSSSAESSCATSRYLVFKFSLVAHLRCYLSSDVTFSHLLVGRVKLHYIPLFSFQHLPKPSKQILCRLSKCMLILL